ncbi:MAG: helix-turn-helix transcriptional regulator [Planctomycetota bacterium]|jgi:predicted DNA-binding transcriptional regulator AlpA
MTTDMLSTTEPKAALDVRAVAARYDTSVSSVWRWVRDGHMPRPVKIAGATRWLREHLEAWERGGCKPV